VPASLLCPQAENQPLLKQNAVTPTPKGGVTAAPIQEYLFWCGIKRFTPQAFFKACGAEPANFFLL